jgi:hypothetical protein
MFNRKKKDIVVVDITTGIADYDKKQLEDEGYIVVYVHGDPNKAVSVLRS